MFEFINEIFKPETKITVSEAIPEEIISKISELRKVANEHENFDVTSDFMDAIADFKQELLLNFLDTDIVQVPLYHHLIGSGVPEGVTYDSPLSAEKQLAIESAIVEFVNNKLSLIVANNSEITN